MGGPHGHCQRLEFATTATPVRLAKSRLIALGVTALPRATGLPPTVGFAMARGLAPLIALWATTPTTGLARGLAAFEPALWL